MGNTRAPRYTPREESPAPSLLQRTSIRVLSPPSEGRERKLLVALRDGPPRLLRNNSDGTFASLTPFGTVSRVRGFAWADIDGEGVPDAALLDDQGVVRVFLNLRGTFSERQVPAQFPRVAAIAVAEVASGMTTTPVEIAPEPVHDDVTWVSAYDVNPLEVPTAEKAALLQRCVQAIQANRGVRREGP